MDDTFRKTRSLSYLPPISPRLCSCDVHDGKFVDRKIQDIEKLILEETKKLNSGCPSYKKSRFTVFRRGFEMLIEESASFKQLLSDINAEYLGVIEAVEKGEHQKMYMIRDLKNIVAEKGTVNNYKKRISDLQEKAEKIRNNNEELEVTFEKLRTENEELRNQVAEKKSSHKLLKYSSRILPGLELEEQTDLEILSASLERLTSNVKETHENIKTKFRAKDQKVLLQKEFAKREIIHSHLVKYNTELKERLEKLNIAVEAGRSTLQNHVEKQSVCDVVLKALDSFEQLGEDRDPLQFLISADEDDPLKKKESEQLVAYVEFFNNLFDFGQYEAAAIHAASSPKGILRTRQALQKFKEIEICDGQQSPLFLFCEALMTTSTDKSDNSHLQLTARMSVECIECALKESGVSLAVHWLNQPCITMSVPLADLLSKSCTCIGACICRCHAVAQGMYQTFGKHKELAIALTRQGKYQALLEYGQAHGSFKVSDYQAILEADPSASLAKVLLLANVKDKHSAYGLSYCSIVQILLENSKSRDQSVLIPFLEDIENNGVCDSKYLRYSTKDLIFSEKASDKMDDQKWNEVIDLCYSNGKVNLAVEILSSLIVRQALNHAAIFSSLDYIS